MKHRALKYSFRELYAGLQEAVNEKLVNVSVNPENGLEIFSYTDHCVYEGIWNDFTRVARGIILDSANEKIVALPFEKFFNLGENNESVPNLPFETFEKIDGSLIIIYHYNGKWNCATRGSFDSEQVRWATEWLKTNGKQLELRNPEVTFLAEAVYPANRVVIKYDYEGLVLLGGFYRNTGTQLESYLIRVFGRTLGWRVAESYDFGSIISVCNRAQYLDSNEEGFVIRFSNGHRIKVKGEEYKKLHKFVSNLTPLTVWELMASVDQKNENNVLDEFRQKLPEEFWVDFDTIVELLRKQKSAICNDIVEIWLCTHRMSDKEFGMNLDTYPAKVRGLLFPFRKDSGCFSEGKSRTALYRLFRPTGNKLEGYSPTSSINKVQEKVNV